MEEFYTEKETLDLERFKSIGVIKNEPVFDEKKLTYFEERIKEMRKKGIWTRVELIELFKFMLPEFEHYETGKFLDSRM